jgi:ribosomal RNA-processing protein 9
LSGSNDGSLALWHVSKKKPLNVKQKAHCDEASKQPTWIASVAALHNTDLIASGSNDGFLRLWKCSDDFFRIEELFSVQLVSRGPAVQPPRAPILLFLSFPKERLYQRLEILS